MKKKLYYVSYVKVREQFLNTIATNVMNMSASLEMNVYFMCTDNKIYRRVYTW